MNKFGLIRFFLSLVIAFFIIIFSSIIWMSLNLETRGHLVHFDALAISPNGENLYVFDSISGEASIISIASKTKVNTFQIDGEVSGMVFNSDGSKAYVLAKRGTKGGGN